MAKVLLMAGGTGGHVFPALAVATELQQRGHQVAWLGGAKGIEQRVVPEANIALHSISTQGLRGNGWLGWLAAPWRLLHAIGQAWAVFRHVRPDLVLGFGGFAAGPGGLVALLTRVPLVVHEQNARPGMTNRYLARLGARAVQAFEGSLPRAATLGNPIRQQLAMPSLKTTQSSLRVLVLGGSLGARALNQSLPECFAQWQLQQPLAIWHQTGEADQPGTVERYQSLGLEASVVPFISDMAKAYAWADVVICRAGALTVSELAAQALPALFVPYPHAVDDHQFANAQSMVAVGAALCLRQDQLQPAKVLPLLRQLGDQQQRQSMAAAALTQAKPEATRALVQYSLDLIGA